MPSITKHIDSLAKDELVNLCSIVSIDATDRTVPELKNLLNHFFKTNPDKTSLIPGFLVLQKPSSNTTTAVGAVNNAATSVGSQSLSVNDLLPIFQSLAGSIAAALPNNNNNSSSPHLFLQECSRRHLKFSGERSENISSFLRSFNKAAELFNFKDEDKLKCLPELLQGNAAVWYKVNKNKFLSWVTLVKELNDVYGKFHSEKQAKLDLLQRTQVYQESIDHFVSCLQDLNNKLCVPLSDSELLSLTLENIHPDYMDVFLMRTPQTIEELKREGREAEVRKYRKKSYRPPPSRLLVDDEFGDLSTPNKDIKSTPSNVTPPRFGARVRTTASQVQDEVSVPDTQVNVNEIDNELEVLAVNKPTSTYKSESGSNVVVTCWNCRVTGHRYSDCREPRQVFCYRCGRPNVYSPDCTCKQNTKKNRSEN